MTPAEVREVHDWLISKMQCPESIVCEHRLTHGNLSYDRWLTNNTTPSGLREVHDWLISKMQCLESLVCEHRLTHGNVSYDR